MEAKGEAILAPLSHQVRGEKERECVRMLQQGCYDTRELAERKLHDQTGPKTGSEG